MTHIFDNCTAEKQQHHFESKTAVCNEITGH